MDNPEQLPTVISFCSGYAGIERGLDLAGVEHRVLAYVEIEAFAIANLVAKMEAGELAPAPIWTNLKTFPAHLFRDCVDIITGGYPCQPFSAAGARKGADDPRHLWPFIRRHTRTIRPARCFFENVEGHISLGLSSVISDLEEDGYAAAWGIFSAEEVGAPHRRKRVFIMADTQSQYAGNERKNFGKAGDKINAPVNSGSVSGGNDRHKNGKPMADGNGKREQQPQRGQQQKRGRLGDSSENKLGDSEDDRFSGRPQNLERERAENIGERSDENLRCQSVGSGEAVADSECTGLEGFAGNGPVCNKPRRVTEKAIGSISPSGVCGRWPARPGQSQHDWEPPRTTRTAKPGLGGDTDGSPDRIDRIRLLGNGVVPSTAAKAWQVLGAKLSPPTEEQKS